MDVFECLRSLDVLVKGTTRAHARTLARSALSTVRGFQIKRPTYHTPMVELLGRSWGRRPNREKRESELDRSLFTYPMHDLKGTSEVSTITLVAQP